MYNEARAAPARMRVKESFIYLFFKKMSFCSDLKTYQTFRSAYTMQKDQQLAVA
jgi:hypothetical protein